MLVGARDLRARLAAGETPTLLDVRWRLAGPPGRDDYAAGHLPGAVFVDLDIDLAAAAGDGGRHPLPDPARFTAAMQRAGVRRDTPVICYDDRDGTSAARCWWLLTYHGHPDVSLLDGGLSAWAHAGGELTPEEPTPPPGDFTAAAGALPVVDASEAARLARGGVLLDARAAERYRGEVEPIDPVAGHIPGAVSAPTGDNVDADGCFLPAEQLRARFAQLGVTAERPVGAYCGSGVTAAHEIYALRLAGFTAALYPGSWSEWVGDPRRPVAVGSGAG